MQTTQLDIVPFGTQHLEGALALSRQAGWPHRLGDWEMALALSTGFVVLENNKVVGTTLTTHFGGCATINMVIVAEAMRGLGLGRRLMDAGLNAARGEPCRLVATEEGLPLYEKVGFRQVGDILQCQGVCAAVEAPIDVEWMQSGDLAEIAALDKAAFGADRSKLISYMKDIGRFAVIRRGGHVAGFGATRAFGRGEVIGPVVAENAEDARKLILFQIAARRDRFLRIDTPKDFGLSQWLAERGLIHVGGATAMQRGGQANLSPRVKTFALANQAFG
ncbi:GNAT family N-acetyltransferase [Rhizobium azibense]|uniref:Acetyltransferase (GNAT) family protein n=1 Tax=Rhizobium azibense TaxID=1136135 RepID=A0A4R3RYI4_9HYPH|nr:GNAT family N-acetyltransferase [Rhizobium azibense]TCU41490.1 acetyltransferase (GNAT) family protein [Rhizobium azibense]